LAPQSYASPRFLMAASSQAIGSAAYTGLKSWIDASRLNTSLRGTVILSAAPAGER
jgi:hypothetical protein